MDWHGKFTAAAGHALYTARAYPKWYWNRVSFVTEGTGHLIHNDVLESVGSGYAARNAYNFVAPMLRDGQLAIDWDDELFARTAWPPRAQAAPPA